MLHSQDRTSRLRKPVVWLSCTALLSAVLAAGPTVVARAAGDDSTAPVQSNSDVSADPEATTAESAQPTAPERSEEPSPAPTASAAEDLVDAAAPESQSSAEPADSTDVQAAQQQSVAAPAATATVPADTSVIPSLRSPQGSPKVDLAKFPIGGPGNTTGAVQPDVAYTTATGGRVEVYSSVGDMEDGTLDWRQVNLYAYLVNSVPKGSKLYSTVYNTLWDSRIPKKDSNGKWYLTTTAGKKVTKDVYAPTVAYLNQLNQYSAAEQKTYLNVLANRSTLNDAIKAKSSLGLLLSSKGANLAKLCNTGLGACFATTTSGSPLMHSKYAIFEKTNDSTGRQWSNVVWITSANLNGQSGGRKSNLSIVLYGDSSAFSGLLNGVWNPTVALAGKNTTHTYSKFPEVFRKAAEQGIWSSDGQFRYYASPRKPGQDHEANFLAAKTNTNLTKALGKTAKKTDCKVYLVHSLFSTARKSVANGLAALQRDGCTVRLVLGESSMANIADAYFSMGTSLRELVNRVEFANVHDKSLVVSYKVDGTRSATTWLGSANLNGTSLYFDELTVKTTSTAVADAAMLQFDRLYPLARTGSKPKPVKSVTLSPTTYNLRAGGSTTLKATLNPTNATVTGLFWRSSNNNVATVSSNGKVTAKSLPDGVTSATVTITATSLSKVKTGKTTVTVYAPGVTMPGNQTATSSSSNLTVTVAPYITITRYAAPKTNRKVVITWGQGNTDLSGKVQLQYLNSSGKWKNSGKPITITNGRKTLNKKFDSSLVWRVKALSVSSPAKAKLSSSATYSNYAPVVARTKSASKKKPWVYATPAVKKGTRAVFLLQWKTPYPKLTTKVYLQYYNGRKWVTLKDDKGKTQYYVIPKGSTLVVASVVVTKTTKWRLKTSKTAQAKGKSVLTSNVVTVKAVK